MTRLNARQIEAFRAVMQLGNMTKAAEILQISQPAVSRLIADLQETVGYTLFTRRRHGTVPTEDARRLLSDVESVFIGLDELSRRAHAIRDLEAGEIRIAAVSLYGNGLLPQIIAAFFKKHPGLTIRLEISPHDQVVDWLVSRRCDLGLTSLPAHSGELDVDRLSARPLLCVLPADHPLTAKPLIQASDLDGIDFVSFPRDSASRYQIDAIFERAGVRRVMRIESGTHESVCNLVAAGVGVSVISPFSPHLHGNPRLAFRPFQPLMTIEIALLSDAERLSVAARAFHSFVVDWFRQYPSGDPHST
ncbi:LysR substrate-binding domain-containing protein [Humitalea sp. 24SJ18S-53]|uniref:LysR substrate-binding domain-containing protein n=1 Tax=Humitalea sp. 24SJ18S-53 TaxID=3422307 RepID=UPI003D66CC65